MKRDRRVASIALAAALSSMLIVGRPGPLAAAPPEPDSVISAADVAKVLGGKWKGKVQEPGVIFYSEDGGAREVHVYLFPANGKTVDSMVPMLREQGEAVDEVAGVGDAAMYRPQGNEATVQKSGKEGEVHWMSVAVHNVDGAAETKKLALELAKRGASKL
jgi:hypothetical protein